MIDHLLFQVILPGYHSFSNDGDFQDWIDNTVSSHDILEEEVHAVHLLLTAYHVVLHYSHINVLSTWYYLCNAPPDITEADV